MRFRADIEGLRGIAVLLVVLFHVGYERFAGGYVGVDVFFVISGFLITGQIVGEVDSSGGLRLVRFWGRRLRRLMPMLVLTVVVTCLLSLVAYSPLSWPAVSRDALASLVYVSNATFARDATFYFQEATSPFLHTWSLSVEEQFYIAWPVIILVAAFVGRRLRRSPIALLTASVVLVSLISFALGVVLTNRGTPWAFYGSPTRAWEFGVGALAMLISRRLTLTSAAGDAVVLLGLSCVVAPAFVYDEFTPFPGVAAVVPVVGTALLIIGGASAVRARRLLEQGVLRHLGRVSYAWYLFHWPAIVLASVYFGTQRRSVFVAAALVSLALAHVATTRLEQPFRESARLRSTRSSFAATGVVVLVLASSLWIWQNRAEAMARSGYLAELAQVRSARSESGSDRCVERDFDGVTACVHGDADAEQVVVLTGDSHAGQWAPAFEQIAGDKGLALVIRARGGCPATDVAVARTGDDEVSGACLQFRAETRAIIAAVEPSAIVVANADYTGRTLAEDGSFLSVDASVDAAGEAARAFAAEVVEPAGAALLVIENNPGQQRDPIECLARYRSSERCSTTSVDALARVDRLSQAELMGFAAVINPSVFRVSPLICNKERCEVEIGEVVTYADADHLSLPFVMKHREEIEDFVLPALDGQP